MSLSTEGLSHDAYILQDMCCIICLIHSSARSHNLESLFSSFFLLHSPQDYVTAVTLTVNLRVSTVTESVQN